MGKTMVMKIKIGINHKEKIIVTIKILNKIKAKIVIIMILTLKNNMITDNIGKITMNKKIKDMKNTDVLNISY